MAISALRINMTGLNPDPAEEAKRYQAALAMAAFADENGFDSVNVEEHHCANNGWLASPITMASMIAAKTERVNICVCALLVTLYDPIRLAEDIAVIDLVSNGRFSFIAGQGYRPIEYHAMDKQWAERGPAMDHIIQTLIQAWSGEPFEYQGQMIRVTPVPVSKPHPLMMIGGMSKKAARRAAHFGLPFYPPSKMPELETVYYQALKENGKNGFVYSPDESTTVLFIDNDPESAWEELGQYFLNEVQEYSSWRAEGIARPMENDCNSVEALRETGQYEIITPEECINRFKANPNYSALLHPLVGGVPIERAWQCLKLYRDKVMPFVKSTPAGHSST